jgi:hypothetical protein
MTELYSLPTTDPYYQIAGMYCASAVYQDLLYILGGSSDGGDDNDQFWRVYSRFDSFYSSPFQNPIGNDSTFLVDFLSSHTIDVGQSCIKMS